MKHLILVALIAIAPALAHAQGPPAPEGAQVSLVGLADGATVKGPVMRVFGLRGTGVAPAGIEQGKNGHRLVFLNRPPLGEGEFGAEEFVLALPADDNHRHFGGGGRPS